MKSQQTIVGYLSNVAVLKGYQFLMKDRSAKIIKKIILVQITCWKISNGQTEKSWLKGLKT